MLTDPGAVPRDALPAKFAEASQGEIAWYDPQAVFRLHAAITCSDRVCADLNSVDVKSVGLCGRCRQFKPNRAHHCSRCGRCVVKMDHHCVWVNNCVGVGNTKFFMLFNAYVLLLTIYALAITALWWWRVTHPSVSTCLCYWCCRNAF